MKKNRLYSILSITLAVLLAACSDQDKELDESKGLVSFQFSGEASAKSALGQNCGPNAVYISIKNSSGKYTHHLKKLQLIKYGDGYITEQLG